MSALAYFGRATVTTTSPLTVTMPKASVAQPASTLGGTVPGVGTEVVIAVREDGTTYLLGTPPPAAAVTAQDVLVPGVDGSVWRVTVSDNVGTLKTTKVS